MGMSADTGLAAEPITPVLLTTFTNPTPASFESFARAVAPVGQNLLVVGARGDETGATRAGVAHIFTTDGTLVTTITNPTPANFDYFGDPVCGLGQDRVLIAAYRDDTAGTDRGAIYLYNTNGSRLLTITNPNPTLGTWFGEALASIGHNCILVGASSAGRAYLFDTNGMLLNIYTNPSSPNPQKFGFSLSALGTDRVVIGNYGDNTGESFAGAAHVFGTNGALLTTITNPFPATDDYFGEEVGVVGTELIVVGAQGKDRGASYSGEAYLFDTNGSLVCILTNPSPSVDALFGDEVIGLGKHHLLVSTEELGLGQLDLHGVHLFRTDGKLVGTITNPISSAGDGFGFSLAAFDANRAIIGAPFDDTGAASAGIAFLFNIAVPFPTLGLRKNGLVSELSWESDEPNLILQQSEALGSAAVWANTPELVTTNGLTNLLQQTVPAGVTNRFYRLRRP